LDLAIKQMQKLYGNSKTSLWNYTAETDKFSKLEITKWEKWFMGHTMESTTFLLIDENGKKNMEL
jgi:hypothetical protein